MCGIFDAAEQTIPTADPPIPTDGNDAAILPSLVTVVLGLACVLGSLQLFQ